MGMLHNFLTRFQLQYRSTPTLTKAVLSTAIVLCTVSLVTLRVSQWEAQEKLALLQEQAAALEQQNQELSERIEDLGTAGSIRQIAREELGLVDPDIIVIEED